MTTNFTLDLNTGLTHVLADGTNTYLYGNGRIGQFAGAESAYFLGDALAWPGGSGRLRPRPLPVPAAGAHHQLVAIGEREG